MLKLSTRMKLLYKILLFVSLLSQLNYSQEIKGYIIDINNNPISMASVVFLNAENKILNYTNTNENGLFSLKIDGNKLKYIEVSCIGFKTKKIEFRNDDKLNIQLEDEIFYLKEVEVVAKKLKDTVDVKISENLTEQSTLKDILKKDHDLQISDNGTIFYEGKPINKILINKKEVFVNQNNLALNNITKGMINKVQVINNYKDKFSFNFDDERNSVINIDTKSSFRGLLKNNLEFGVGIFDKYNLKLKSIYFSDKLNLFVTNNTNNIFDKDFKFENNNIEVQNLSSSYYKNIQNDFISDERNISKSFLSSSSITLRKEFEKTKLSLIIYQNYLKNYFETKIERFDNNKNAINTNQNNISKEGNLNLFNFQISNFLNKSNILTFDLNAGVSNSKKLNNTSSIFSDNTNVETLEKVALQIFNIANSISLKQKINSNLIGLFETNLYVENSHDNLLGLNNNQSINQNLKLNFSKFKSSYLIDYNFNNKYLNFGIDVKYNKEQINSSTFFVNNEENTLSVPVTFRGNYKKHNYFFKLNSTYWQNRTNDVRNDRLLIPISFSNYYKMNRKKSLNLFFERNFSRNDILLSVPELYRDLFSLYTSDSSFNNELSTKNTFGLQYTYYNFSKSHYLSLSTNFSRNYNVINHLFDRLENNILYYVGKLTDLQAVFNTNLIYSKGWHFSEKLHKITINPRFEFLNIKNKVADLSVSSNGYKQNYLISFEPTKWFFKEMNLSYTNNHTQFYENSSIISDLTNEKYMFSTICENNKFIFKSNIYMERFKTTTAAFTRKDLNFSFTYKINNTLNASINANSILTLLKIDNEVSNITTSNNQGITTTETNPNILGYLVANINYNF